ncbi:asparagine synthase-related protein [Streptomyces sp. NRRL S-337]|uniref:asparagine synthase-related protein n=1 Tax=Streptomyces sp. NRRL S-337 TaxID=1463900 RepID=UPI00068E9574|nr:asparagine synthase-related protein [Streptomyces sp. NRRL S-337]
MDFLVFPDHPATDALCRHLPAGPPAQILRHPSGRPWIVGRWSADQILTAEAGPRRAVLLGTTSARPDTLARLLHGPDGLDGIARRTRQLPGSYVLLAAVGPELRCQGDLATVHQLHHARIGGITVAGNQPQNLAALARSAATGGLPPGAPGTGLLDEESLALRLLFPFAPLPLALRPLWRAVPAVPPGHHLTVDANGQPTVARWWQPPEPDVPLERAAETVRQALSDAIAARTHRARRQAERTERTEPADTGRATGGATSGATGGTAGASTGGTTYGAGQAPSQAAARPTLSADLSGGTDSTGLCFLAAQEDVRLITTSWVGRDPGNDDTMWSARSAAYLSAAERQREQSAAPGSDPGCGRTPRTEGDTTHGQGKGKEKGKDKNKSERNATGEYRPSGTTPGGSSGRARDRGRGSGGGSGRSTGHSPRSRSQPQAGEHLSLHLSLPYADAPTWYTPPHHPLTPTATDPAAPLALFREAARIAHQARLVAARGSRLHLVGVGGDELFAHRPAALNSLARSDLRTAARRAWTVHHLCHWKTSQTLRTLLGGRPYPRWLAGSASRVTTGGDPRICGADWEVLPSLPPWAHPDAVATVRRLLREAAAEAPEPFAPLRCQHDIVRAAVRSGEIVRGAVALTAPHGVDYEAPFLDNAVIDAALTLQLADRARPGVYKPLLTRALRGIVPDAVLGRGTKGEHSAEVYAGLRAHRGALSALCDDSRLAERGLIRPAVLRHHLTSLQPRTDALRALDPTLATEYWLRALTPAAVPGPSRPAPSRPAPLFPTPPVSAPPVSAPPFPAPPLSAPARGTP